MWISRSKVIAVWHSCSPISSAEVPQYQMHRPDGTLSLSDPFPSVKAARGAPATAWP